MGTVNMISPEGDAIAVDDTTVDARIGAGWRMEGDAESAGRIRQGVVDDRYGGIVGGAVAAGAGIARSVTGGLSDVAANALGAGDDLRNFREVNPELSTAGEVAGAISGVGFAGRATQLGQRIAKVGEGASFATKALRAGAGYGTEGALQGLGTGVSELALSDDPLTVERIGSVLSSNVLLGGAIGGGAGILGKVAEKGLVRAKGLLDDAAKKLASPELGADLATLDAKGLRAAEKLEVDAIEAARVPQRAQVAEELSAFRKELKDSKIWLATNKSGVDGLESVGKRTFKADKALDNLLDDPKALAVNPQGAMRHLRVQEAALQDVMNKSDDLRKAFVADTSGARTAALDKVPGILERNRALQTKLTELSAAPASARLGEITTAREALQSGSAQGGKGIGARMVEGTAFGAVTGAISAVPGIGQIPGLAPLLGAKAASMLGDLVTGRIGKAASEVAARSSAAIDKFLEVGKRIAPAAPVLASKVLSSVRYAQEKQGKRAPEPSGKTTLASAFKERSSELRSQTAYGPEGKPVMRQEARLKMASALDPVRTLSPILADRLETLAARRVEFLASKLPRKPEIDSLPIGPDNWQPSELEMRKFARYAAAVEDPGGIEERLTSGQTTPEDAEVMRTVYPERYANIVGEIVQRLPELRGTLPYERRLALSIFSGVPVDAAMNPRILSVLQQTYTTEEGTEQGTQAPKPKPAFGSVKGQDRLPSEQRQGATT